MEIVEAGADILAACREHGPTGQGSPSSVRTEGWPAWTWVSLAGWDLAPATAIIGLGQGMALPSLIGAALSHVPPERAGAAAGILTTAQQFGVASGVAVIGAVFYTRLGVTLASSVSAVELAMAVNAVVVLAAAALTMLLPRQSPARRPAGRRPATDETPAVREYTTEALH